MENPRINSLQSEANQLLAEAQVQILKAEEDVVTHLVCQNSRKSMVNYLSGFLLQKGIEPQSTTSLTILKEQCKKLDPKFDLLDFSSMACRHEKQPEEFCMTIDEVGHCLTLAKQTKKLTNL